VDTTVPTVTIATQTTADTTPAISGTIDDPTATVQVTVDGNTYAATNNGDGTWTLADSTITPALVDGTYDITVTVSDNAGNISNEAVIGGLTISSADLTPPVVEVPDESLDDLIVPEQLLTVDAVENVGPVSNASGSASDETNGDEFGTSGSVLDTVERATQNLEINSVEIGERLADGAGLFDAQGIKGFSVSFELSETSTSSTIPDNSLFPLRIGVESELEEGSDARENDQLVIRSILRERTLYLEVNYIVVSNPDLTTSSYSVTLANGDPMPSWLRLDDKGGLVSGEPPVGIQDIRLRIEVILSDGTTIIRYVSVDTFTGEITAMRDIDNAFIAGIETFTEQLNGVDSELEQLKNELTAALQQ
jgi:hypothetical protein